MRVGSYLWVETDKIGIWNIISSWLSIGQIALDTKNIKDLLNYMVKYISNKKINLKTANEFKDFDGIGDVVWNFISLVYQSSWDSLYTDNKSKTLREDFGKIHSKNRSLFKHKEYQIDTQTSPCFYQ